MPHSILHHYKHQSHNILCRYTLFRALFQGWMLCWALNALTSGLPTLTVSPWVSRFQCKSHSLTATQANLTGSPLRHVNIYKCYSNSASDVDFLPQQTKYAAWCWKRLPNFAYRGRELHGHDTKPCIHKLCKRQRLVLMRFLTWNYWSFCSGCGLRTILLEPHPPDNLVSRFLE